MTFLAGIVFLMFSCNSGNKDSSEANPNSVTENSNSKDSGKTYDCLKKYEDDYSGLITNEEIISVYPVDFNTAKKNLRSGSYGEYIYRWPSDRPSFTIEASGMKIEVPDQNTIGVKMLSFFSEEEALESIRETFDMAYKELSDKELERIQANLEKQSEEIKETGKDLMKVRSKRNWDFVEGLGSSAWFKWNENYGGELAVLAGRSKFYVELKISNDPGENKEVARKIAQKVLAKCN